jgi:O-antigen/teichoic acid export membrane protein
VPTPPPSRTSSPPPPPEAGDGEPVPPPLILTPLADASPAEPSGRRALADIVVQIGGRLVNGLLGVVVLVVLARGLSTSQFGAWTTLTTVILLGTTLSDLGFTSVAVTQAATDHDSEAQWLGALLVVRSGMALAAALGCIAVVLVLDSASAVLLAGALLSVTVLVGGLGAPAAVFQLRVRNHLSIIVMTVNSIGWTAGALLVQLRHGSLVAFAIAFTIANLLAAATQAWLALRHTRISLAGLRARVRTIVRVGLPVSVATVLTLSYGRVDQILVFADAGQRAAGLYGAAYRVLDQATVIPMSIATTLYPMLVRAHAERRDRLGSLLQPALEAILALSLGALVITIVCGGPIMALVFGHPYGATGTALAVLIGAFVVISLNYLLDSMILMLRLQKASSVIALAALVFNIAFNAALLPVWGYLAAALATLLTEALVLVLTGRRVFAAMAFRPHLRVAGRAVLAALLSLAVFEPLHLTGSPLGLLLPGCALLYAVLVIVLGGIDLPRLRSVLRGGSTA